MRNWKKCSSKRINSKDFYFHKKQFSIGLASFISILQKSKMAQRASKSAEVISIQNSFVKKITSDAFRDFALISRLLFKQKF
jgi:hypothetical protein